MDELEILRASICDAIKDAGGPLLYRGESANYPEVSSTLWRKCNEWRRNSEDDLNDLQEILTRFARQFDNPDARKPRESEKHLALWSGGYDPTSMSEEEVELMGELQHWGAATNLIDFTTDVDVAIYFACEEKWECDGRVVIIRKSDWPQWRLPAKSPEHRVTAQKSVFLRPSKGVVTPWQQIKVSREDKPALLEQLSQLETPITATAIYNDIFGYIRLNDRYVAGMDYYHEGQATLAQYIEMAMKGRCNRELEEKMKSLFRKACEKLFWTGGVWAELGRASFYCGEFDEARSMIHKAMQMKFLTPSTFGILANIALKEKKNGIALQYAKQGLALFDKQGGDQGERRGLEWVASEAEAQENAGDD